METSKCKTIIATPARYEDEKISDTLTMSWLKGKKKKLNSIEQCYRLFDQEAAKRALVYINVDHNTNLQDDPLTNAQMKNLQRRTKADIVAVLTYTQTDNTFEITPKFVNLITRQEEKIVGLEEAYTVQLKPGAIKNDFMSKLKFQTISLFPNSATFGYTNKQLTNKYLNKEVFEKDRVRNSRIPQIVSGIEIREILHPKAYGIMDVGFRWYPNVNFYYVDDTYTYSFTDPKNKEGPQGEDFEYRIFFFGTVFTLVAEGAIYSPLGTTFALVGGGTGFFKIRDDFSDLYGVAPVITVGFGHRTFFFTDNFYASLSIQSDYFGKRLVDNPVFKSSNTDYISLSVGYFFPRIRTWARKALD
ncbi:MAG: hypothetical protein AB7T49_02900 [Oligoflexales bacterium]